MKKTAFVLLTAALPMAACQSPNTAASETVESMAMASFELGRVP